MKTFVKKDTRLDSGNKLDNDNGSQDEIDVLYYPKDIIFSNMGRSPVTAAGPKKTFYAYREMVQDKDFMRVTQKLGGPFNNGTTSKEMLTKKLSWNDTMRRTHTNMMKDISEKMVKDIIKTNSQWNKMTRNKPLIIKR